MDCVYWVQSMLGYNRYWDYGLSVFGCIKYWGHELCVRGAGNIGCMSCAYWGEVDIRY